MSEQEPPRFHGAQLGGVVLIVTGGVLIALHEWLGIAALGVIGFIVVALGVFSFVAGVAIVFSRTVPYLFRRLFRSLGFRDRDS